MKKKRRYFFTWNNWQKDFIDKDNVIEYFQGLPDIKAYVIGFEKGEKGTDHLQGVLLFNQAKTFNTMREYLKNNHIEPIIKLDSAVDYCKKENDYIEFGDVVGQGQRSDIVDFRDAIIDGMTDIELLEQYPSQYFRYERSISKIRTMYLNEFYSKNNRDLKVVYLGGSSGAGKTSYVYRNFDVSQIHRVTDYDNPFDSYTGQKILVLDEFHSQFAMTQMLNLLDIYPLELPARYNNKWACYDTVFIISNKPIYEQYTGIQEFQPEVWRAFMRRITNYYWLDNNDESREKVYNSIENDLIDMPF